MKVKIIFVNVFLSLIIVLGINNEVLPNVDVAHFDNTVITETDDVAFTRSDSYQVFKQDSLVLSREKVEDWIKLRIKVAQLQNKMKENAKKYKNVVESFSIKRQELLIAQGWTVIGFDEAKERIHAAILAMDIAEELQESQADHEKEVSEIRQNNFYTDSQKEQMIEGLKSMRKQQKVLYVEPTKKDWPAVRPYRSLFKEVASWIAGNRSDLPKLPL